MNAFPQDLINVHVGDVLCLFSGFLQLGANFPRLILQLCYFVHQSVVLLLSRKDLLVFLGLGSFQRVKFGLYFLKSPQVCLKSVGFVLFVFQVFFNGVVDYQELGVILFGLFELKFEGAEFLQGLVIVGLKLCVPLFVVCGFVRVSFGKSLLKCNEISPKFVSLGSEEGVVLEHFVFIPLGGDNFLLVLIGRVFQSVNELLFGFELLDRKSVV